jgi:ribonuclease P protein component
MSNALARLTQRSQFLGVARRGRRWAAPGLVLQMAPQNATRKEPTIAAVRIGFTASKKVGNAVMRNRAKRRLRAIAADILATTGRCGHDYVLIGRQGTLTRPYDALCEDLKTALQRVHQKHKRRQ